MIKGTYQTDYENYLTIQVGKIIYNTALRLPDTIAKRKLAIPPLIAWVIATECCDYDPIPIEDGAETGAFYLELGTKGVKCDLLVTEQDIRRYEIPPNQEIKPVV